MPRLTKAVPKYQKHRASGQAVVRLNGQDHYLGPHGTKTSHVEYDRLIGEWLANGRRLTAGPEQEGVSVAELLSGYWQYAKGYYRKNGEPTDTLSHVKVALRFLKEGYSHTQAADFGPLAFKAVRGKMVAAGHSRGYVNRQMGHVVRLFKWGVENELAPASVYQSLATVSGLKKGRTEAPDHAPVKPVPESSIQAALSRVSPIVADMIRLQRLTGCRPDEVCILRPCDVDRSTDVWIFRPESHKTEHQGRERQIFIGPKGQAILSPYLLREADAYAFSPVDAQRKRHAEQRAQRKTKVQPSQVDRSKGKPKRKAGDRYTTGSYRRAIHRACDRAGIDRWSPNRLRHSAGTEIRKEFGLEAAQVALGHASADITQVYAERDAELARDVARKIG